LSPFPRPPRRAGAAAALLLLPLLLLPSLGPAPAARAQDRPPGEDAAAQARRREERLEALLRELSRELGEVETLRASFVQRKYLEVFEEEVESRGTLALKAPGKLRWEYTSPVKSVLVVNGERAMRERTSRKGETTRRVYSVAEDPVTRVTSAQVFLWARGRFAEAREGYELSLVSEEPLRLRAVPKDERVREVVAAVELTFAAEEAGEAGAGDGDAAKGKPAPRRPRVLTGVALEEPSRARTRVEFRDVERNPELPDELFRVESPR